MSHEIETFADGSASFISAMDTPWHLLGTVKEGGYLSIEEMLTGSNADYTVTKEPIFSEIVHNGRVYRVENPNKVHTIRFRQGEPQILGTVGTDYKVIQNREAFEFGQALLDTDEVVGETAGVLYDGRQAFCCFRLPEAINVGGVDPVQMYLVIHTSHDSSAVYCVMHTKIRVVCKNTLNMALGDTQDKYELRHTKNAVLDLEEVKTVLGMATDNAESFTEIADKMLNTPVSDTLFEQIITKEFGPKRDASKRMLGAWETKKETLQYLFAEAPTQAEVRGTGWAAFNAVAEYQDWNVLVKGVGSDQQARATAQFTRSITGAETIVTPKLKMQRAVLRYH